MRLKNSFNIGHLGYVRKTILIPVLTGETGYKCRVISMHSRTFKIDSDTLELDNFFNGFEICVKFWVR